MTLAIFCLFCAPAQVHCVQMGTQENCTVVARDDKQHILQAAGMGKISFEGKKAWGFSRTGFPPLNEVKVDGKKVKVKR